jgi:pSer/pThr/pTyr-binding forkhead associated (FHA) protein
MICVLDVTSGPARGRRFWLRTHQRVEIGRISSADFAVPADPHMSRRHLILEGTVSSFRVRDVGSANGTFVNNTKIQSVELCTGDRIRAGETTFEVSMLEDDQNPHGKDGVLFSSSLNKSVAAPLAASEIRARRLEPPVPEANDAEQTRRCHVSEEAKSVLKHGKRHSVIGTVLSNNTWWADFNFRVSDVPCLLDESLERSGQTSLLPDMLQRLEPEYVLTAVVDVDRLGRFARQQLGTLVELGLVTWHAPSVCSITDDRSRDVVRMIESSLMQDALILLGARVPLDPTWLEYFVSQVSRPSHLNQLLREPQSELIHQLLSTVEFVIFEQDRQGRLSLLLRDLVELSE